MEPGTAQLSMTVLMTPDMANFSGNVHGGTLLKYLDEVAYACASYELELVRAQDRIAHPRVKFEATAISF